MSLTQSGLVLVGACLAFSGPLTAHTLRHTALSRMIAQGVDDYTVMEISGHSTTRMLGRYTHPTEQRKIGALDLPWVVTNCAHADGADPITAKQIAELLGKLVDGARIELATSALRTQRSPS